MNRVESENCQKPIDLPTNICTQLHMYAWMLQWYVAVLLLLWFCHQNQKTSDSVKCTMHWCINPFYIPKLNPRVWSNLFSWFRVGTTVRGPSNIIVVYIIHSCRINTQERVNWKTGNWKVGFNSHYLSVPFKFNAFCSAVPFIQPWARTKHH